MINTKQLRLGNWIEFGRFSNGDLKVSKVTALNEHSIMVENYDFSFNYSNAFPIRLNEEWLEKFGFRSNPYQDRYELDSIYFEGCKLNFECDKTKGWTKLWCEKYPKIEFVHQLQNLYFEVTGEELTQVSEGENKNFV